MKQILLFLFLAGNALLTAPNLPATEERYEFSRPQMGMPFHITLYAPDEKSAEEAATAAYRRVKEINAIMSDYEPDSELSRLSRSSGSGQAVPVSDQLWFVLTQAQQFSERTDGAFDITVGPCSWLWRKARREHRLPDPALLAETLKSVGYKKIQLDPAHHTATLLVPKMRLDLGAVAKGYAIDQSLIVLREHGIRSALVSCGGDMAMSDPPPGKPGWRIELPPLDPEASDKEATHFLILANTGFATSGDFFQNLEIDGKRYSHIMDPKTGIGLTDHSQVEVIASGCMLANSFSTPAGILGPVKALEVVKTVPGTEIRIAHKPAGKLEIVESPGFSKYFAKE